MLAVDQWDPLVAVDVREATACQLTRLRPAAMLSDDQTRRQVAIRNETAA